ncbi:MAG TPA: pyridoxal-dependent decarboxylase [Candidatus Polarisedimenticolaceae bacterium]|nr:pyridoxal-dependent decarboxylase [Candidatus Polarisedimenticolaceae bacterium]
MGVDEFRREARRVADRVADYLERLESFDVLPKVEPGVVGSRLPAAPPLEPEPMERILGDYHALIEPNVTHWQHPGFMAYFPSVASGPGILGEWLATGLNSNVMFWRNAPASTELEQRVVDWMRRMLGLPEPFDGMFTDTASVSSMLSLVAARHAIPGLDSRDEGLAGRDGLARPRLYVSTEAHMSIEKAAIVSGIGRAGVRHIPTDAEFRMRPDALDRAIAEDRAAGWLPFCVVGTLGTTSSSSVDPPAALARICRREGLWLHLDAAYAGVAAIVPEMRHHFDGWEQADSIVINPHKWMFTPFDASLLLFREADRFRDAFSLVPEYLKTGVGPSVRNYNEFGVQLGRRFRALKIWFEIRYFGVDGIAARLREHCRMAREFAGWVAAAPDWELLAPVPFSTVCFRHRPPAAGDDERRLEAVNQAILDRVNRSGRVYLSHTKLRDRFTLRVVVGNPRQTIDHVHGCWTILQQAARQATGS